MKVEPAASAGVPVVDEASEPLPHDDEPCNTVVAATLAAGEDGEWQSAPMPAPPSTDEDWRAAALKYADRVILANTTSNRTRNGQHTQGISSERTQRIRDNTVAWAMAAKRQCVCSGRETHPTKNTHECSGCKYGVLWQPNDFFVPGTHHFAHWHNRRRGGNTNEFIRSRLQHLSTAEFTEWLNTQGRFVCVRCHWDDTVQTRRRRRQ
jgi:hypothetical protein